MQPDENPKVQIRLRISENTQQTIAEFKKQHEAKTYSDAIEKMCVAYEKLQKEITVFHTLDDVLQSLDKVLEKLSSLEKQHCAKTNRKIKIPVRRCNQK